MDDHTSYRAFPTTPAPEASCVRREKILGRAMVMAGLIGLAVIAMTIAGPSRLARASVLLPAAPPTEDSAGSVHGDCKCEHSSGSVCCCCSHCGCGSNNPMHERRHLQSNSSSPKSGGNWDIDVGGIGTAGGGYCQCNGMCCCCSSCECTGPGTSVKDSNVTIQGSCNSVGGANCNGELPARRRMLSERIRGQLDHLFR